MSKHWEYMSRDEKLDYIRERIENIDNSLTALNRLLEVREAEQKKLKAMLQGDDIH